jgi:hypothetical protein
MIGSSAKKDGLAVMQNRQWRHGAALYFFYVVLFFAAALAGAEENGTLAGLVTDVSGTPVAGAEVSVYRTDNTRRPADYNGPTDRDGRFRVILPPGQYWAVARLREGKEKFGPLLPGDKHSGAPVEIELLPGEEAEEEFVVADLEETFRLVVKYDTSFVRAEGILMTRDGKPVADAYAFANRHEGMKRIPDYVSAWTDSSGRYALFLPPGTYYFGMALEFPPGLEQKHYMQVSVDSDRKNINIVIDK